jgi:hypothetical protein
MILGFGALLSAGFMRATREAVRRFHTQECAPGRVASLEKTVINKTG